MLQTARRIRKLLCLAALALSAAVPLAQAQSGNGTVVYTYDALGRVTGASYDNNTTITYSYDAAGNRIQQSVAIGAAPGTPPSPPPPQGLLPGSTQWTTNGTSIYYNGGNVGVGTSSPVAPLTVVGNSIPSQVTIENLNPPSSSNVLGIASFELLSYGMDPLSPWIFYAYAYQPPSLTGNFCIGLKGVNEAMCLTRGGLVGIGNSAPTHTLDVGGNIFASGTIVGSSDRRLKKEIKPLALDGLATVAKLKPVSFVWKAPKDPEMKGTQLGFIAQDVEKVLPEVVLTATDEQKTKGLKYEEFIPVLALAIQQLKAANDSQAAAIRDQAAEIREQQAEIGALRADVKKLTADQLAASK